MDAFSIGLILRQLIAAGLPLKSLAALVLCGGFVFMLYKVAQAVGAFLQRMIESRDATFSQLAKDLKASDERRAAYDRDTAAILATINTKLDANIGQHDETKRDIQSIKDSMNVLKGAVS